jgi:hypothetical protein
MEKGMRKKLPCSARQRPHLLRPGRVFVLVLGDEIARESA